VERLQEPEEHFKNRTSFQLSDECLRLITRLSETLGINQTAVVEQAVRKLAGGELPAEELAAHKGPRAAGDSATAR
jgi:hypothetical protein